LLHKKCCYVTLSYRQKNLELSVAISNRAII